MNVTLHSLQVIYSDLVTKSQSAAEPYFAHFQADNLRFTIRNWDCYRLNGDKIMKHTSLALHNAHCCSFPWQSLPRKRDRLSQAACLNFWLQPSATLLVSFIFSDSVNLSLWALHMCGCVSMCVFSSANGKRRQRRRDRSELIRCSWLSYRCPWPLSVFTGRTECTAGIKMLCKVRTLGEKKKKSWSVYLKGHLDEDESYHNKWINNRTPIPFFNPVPLSVEQDLSNPVTYSSFAFTAGTMKQQKESSVTHKAT